MNIMWAIVVIGGPLILGAVLIYGTVQYRRRDRRLDPVSDRGAREVRKDIARDEEKAARRDPLS